jgi:hypothetical protein
MAAEETFKMATRESKAASDLGEQASALAEQLGRIAGTIEGTAEAWLDRPSLTRRLTQIRDDATRMLAMLGGTDSQVANSSRRPHASQIACVVLSANT